MRILYLSHQPRFWGGAPQSLYELLESIDHNKVTPFFASPYDDEVAAAIKKSGIPFIKILPFSLKKPHWLIITTLRLVIFILKHRINIIHNNQCIDARYSWLAGNLTLTPQIIHHRDSRYFKIDKWLIKHTKYNISNSEWINEKFLNGQGITLHNAIDIKKYPDNIIDSKLNTTDKIFIGIIGRIQSIKGQDVFIKAAQIVLKKNRNIYFKIIGDIESESYPEYTKHLIELVKKYKIEDYVEFPGYTTNPIEAIKSLDIVVCSSSRESFGRVIIESMACFKPMITTSVGIASEEIIKSNVVLVPYGDPNELATAILRLSGDENLRIEMGLRGREIVNKHFTIEQTLSKLYKIYEGIYAEKKF